MLNMRKYLIIILFIWIFQACNVIWYWNTSNSFFVINCFNVIGLIWITYVFYDMLKMNRKN